jgi:hypothetical protein
VKQTRKVFGGENRQEVEKTWRRNVPGEANPGKWTLNADDAVGTVKTPWKESTLDQAPQGTSSEGDGVSW